MHRIALMLGVMTTFAVSASAMAAEDNAERDKQEAFRFELSCSFRSDVKGFEKCRSVAVVHREFRKGDMDFDGDEDWAVFNEQDHHERYRNRLAIACNDRVIFDDGARIDHDFDTIKITAKHSPIPNIELIRGSLIPHKRRQIVSAWLNLTEARGTGFCEIRTRKLQNDRVPIEESSFLN